MINTLLVLTSDHAGFPGSGHEVRQGSQTRGLRGAAGNLNLGIATGSGGVDRGGHPVTVQAQHRPSRRAQNDKGNLPAREILLVADILVGGQQHLKPGVFRRSEQLAVTEPVPFQVLGDFSE